MREGISAMPDFSIVIPCFNEQDNVSVVFKEIKKVMPKSFEVIFIDDGSSDETLPRIQSLAQKHSEVKYVAFSRNFGHQAALRAGLRHASGRAVISMDADLQHPPKLLPRLIKEWKSGYDVVYTVRQDSTNTSHFKRITSRQFYKILNYLSELNLDEGAADFRLLDRKVVDTVNNQHEADLFLRGYINWLGFKQKGIEYVPATRFSGTSKYTFKKMFRMATHGMTQFSIKPLRFTIVVGTVFAMLGAVYGAYVLVNYFTANNTASGWTSLSIVILITSGIQLVLLGIVGEYVGKIFLQTKQRPEYLVRETNVS